MGVPNIEFSVFDSAARGKVLYPTLLSAEQINLKWKGVRLFLVISAAQGTSPTFDLKLQSKDPSSGTWIDLTGASFAQQTSTQAGLDFTVYPGITVVANRSIANLLSRIWRASITIGGTAAANSSGTITAGGVGPANTKVVVLGTVTYRGVTALTELPAQNTLTSSGVAVTNNKIVTLNTTVYKLKTALTEVRASATLTSTGTQVTAGDNFTIGWGANRKTYTLVSALSSPAIPNEILFEINAAVTLANLKLAITQTSGSATKWSANTEKHPTVDATTNTNTTQKFIARTAGQAGNVFESSTVNAGTLSFGGAVFAGGVDAVAYEVLKGASAAVTLANLKLAVTAGARTDQAEEYSTGTLVHPTINATTNTSTTQLFVAKSLLTTAPNAYPTTTDEATYTWAATTLGGVGATQVGIASIAKEIKVQANAALSLTAIKAAVNADPAQAGIMFSTATVANPDATATTNTATVQTFVAVSAVKAVGDAVLLSSDDLNLTASAATLTGGVNEAQFTFSLGGVYLV